MIGKPDQWHLFPVRLWRQFRLHAEEAQENDKPFKWDVRKHVTEAEWAVLAEMIRLASRNWKALHNHENRKIDNSKE